MKYAGTCLIGLLIFAADVRAQESLPAQKKGNTGAAKSGGAGAAGTTAKSGSGTKSGANPAGGSTKSSAPATEPRAKAPESRGKDVESRAKEPESRAKDSGPKSGVNGNKGSASKPLTAATKDHVSYAIGLDLAARFKSEADDVNFEMIIKGLKDGYAGAKPVFTEAQMQAAMLVFQQHMQLKAEQQLQTFAAENAAFLDSNRKKPGVKVTKSGLQYQVLKSGTGKIPKSSDWIRANYHGTLIDGNVFETTSGEGGEPIEIAVADTIPGWTEALGMMKVGEKWRLFIPSDLAYGEQGQGPVPPHATLIFDLELVDIVKPPAEEKEARSNQLRK